MGTHPVANNGQGLPPDRVKRRVIIIERLCDVLSGDKESYREWKRLVEDYAVIGVKVHDARLVSVMLRGGVRRIFTLHEDNFGRYAGEGIEIVTPETLVSGPH